MPRRLAFGSPPGRPMSLSRIAAVVLVAASVLACSSSSAPSEPPAPPAPPKIVKAAPTPLASLADAVTTVDAMLVAKTPRQSYRDGPNPSATPEAIASYLERGFGELVAAAGQPYVTRIIDGGTPPAPGKSPKIGRRFSSPQSAPWAESTAKTRFPVAWDEASPNS